MKRMYLNLRSGEKSEDINLLFPGWAGEEERVAVFGPHDDDPLIGAGYALDAAAANGAQLFAVLFCKGDCGYSVAEQKDQIVELRRAENEAAMTQFGIPPQNVLRFDYQDFNLMHSLGAQLENGEDGIFRKLVRFIRENRITRVLVPNGFYEHMDHTAAYLAGAFDVVQAGDPILADYGPPQRVKTYLQYSVWAEFSPADAAANKENDLGVRANRAILSEKTVEEKIFASLRRYASQQAIIEDLMAARQERDTGAGYVELYVEFDPRPKLSYAPYLRRVCEILKQ